MGDETDYTLASMELNRDLPAGTFSYTPPPDFRIKDHLGRAGAVQVSS